ncbi:hypothetical protein [Flexithrix dorotheae]|uniref:hypothetical protein n=1 Tax=Flexithrix dorotheae TaxID=70993 RepID=UPI00036042D8|nr:hypothetical protein [Flexithrix dorotheae]
MIIFNLIEDLLFSKAIPPIKSWVSKNEIIDTIGVPDEEIRKDITTEIRYGNYSLIFENYSGDLLEINNINDEPFENPNKLFSNLLYSNSKLSVIAHGDNSIIKEVLYLFGELRFLLDKKGIKYNIQKVRRSNLVEMIILQHENGLFLEFMNIESSYNDPYPNGKPYFKVKQIKEEKDYVLCGIWY